MRAGGPTGSRATARAAVGPAGAAPVATLALVAALWPGRAADAAGLASQYAVWSLDLGALGWAVAALVAYGVLWRRLPEKPHSAYAACFVAGVAATVLTLSSPLDTMGETVLLTMHMLEHMALTLVSALVLVIGIPPAMLRRVLRLPVIGFIVERFWNLRGMVLYNAVILAWHVPFFYEAALRNEQVHDAEHLCFLLFGMLFWGPVARPITPGTRRAGAPLRRLAGVFLALLVNTVLGSYIFFAQRILYPTYAAAPRVWGLIDVQTDQSIAGGCLWVMGDMAYIIAAGVLVAAWMAGNEQPLRPAGRAPGGAAELASRRGAGPP